MARNTNRTRGKNNNPEGYNQYNSGWMDTAKEKPFTTAAAAAAAVGAGVFLWSRRNQISDQINNLSDQISDWSQSMRSDGERAGEFAIAGDTGTFETSTSGKSKSAKGGGNGRSGKGISETGAGTGSLGVQSGSTGIGAGS